jgi:hypothetical protein
MVDGPVTVRGRNAAGLEVLDLPPVQWRRLGLEGEGWRAVLDGDRKVEATAEVTLAEVADVPGGAKRGLRVDYRFGDGWRFAGIQPPPDLRGIDGRPRAVGMWVHGDDGRDVLRMRFRDQSGQTFQVDHGVIDWRGWKWVELPLDGSSAHAWGGAGDGVVHYPIRWEAVVLLDNGKLRNVEDRRVYVAGAALRY